MKSPPPLTSNAKPLKIRSIRPRPIDWQKWTRVAGGFEIASENGLTQTVMDSQLQSVDSFVPGALARFLDPALKDSPTDPNFEYKIRVWENPLVIEATTSSQISIRAVRQLELMDAELIMMCDGSYYVDKPVPDTGVTIMIPIGSTNAYFSLSTAYLDTDYPGWRDRLNTALSLEMDLTTTLLHLIDRSPRVLQVELPENVLFKY